MSAQECSAGVVVFRSDPDKPTPDSRQYLLLDYGRFWDYPKGHVENGEDALTAAIRELEEETGISDAALIDGFRHEIKYFFRDKNKRLVRKSVVFFLAETRAQKLKVSHEHTGAEFLSYEDALHRLSYQNAKSILRAAHAHLDTRL